LLLRNGNASRGTSPIGSRFAARIHMDPVRRERRIQRPYRRVPGMVGEAR
jgi:hypothetical protein